MSATTTERAAVAPTPTSLRGTRAVPEPIGFGRIVGVEMRKTFDTRAGFWLLVSIGAVAVLASLAVTIWAPDAMLSFETFGTAIGMPMAVLLPVVAILAVTSEWSQRSGLTTFTLVPRRGRTIAAKAVVTVIVGVVSMTVAMGIGAAAAVLAPLTRGLDPSFTMPPEQFFSLVLAQVLGMFVGFMLGVVTRSSAVAIVAYFVFNGLIPTLSGLLSTTQEWFRDIMPWVDFSYTQNKLYEGGFDSTEWAQLGVTGLLWIGLPLAVGLWMLMRAEIK